ncbi:hypothetical protein [Roseomonas sp. CECT 9278]|uniref:hypothetical protein n=1 Tax=Roseomonas sp. CECT 9278 TaxID=2845823 RepID=UPI001E5E5390|nr:hypothetical protein [Roseomonas sp. CECT 9278]CAH0235859.1 hypothetical protein ROS9278_02768 [Roseomonas sp. CECT 9278]
MRAAVIRGGTLGALATLLLAAPARADCFDWSHGQAVIEDGAIRGLPPGALRWRIGRVPAGGVHLSTAVELRWTLPGGRSRTQHIFEGLQDGRVQLDRQGTTLRLRVTACGTGDAQCRDVALTYAWDREAQRFAGATPAARQALDSACAAEEPAR